MISQTELYLMMTVTGRDRMPDFIRLYQDKGLDIHWLSLGHGTANRRYLRYLGLDDTEKMVCMTVVTGRKWLEVKKAMSVRLRIVFSSASLSSAPAQENVGGSRRV